MRLEEILLFTQNSNKVREFKRILDAQVRGSSGEIGPVRLHTPHTRPGDYVQPEEDGRTFVQNAMIKAAAGVHGAGIPCLADDSGLEVAALDGQPGVRSARFAQDRGAEANLDAAEANNALLLEEMAGQDDRRARFVCALCLVLPERLLPMVDLPRMRGITLFRTSALIPYSWSAIVSEGLVEGHITREPRGAGGFGYDPIFFSTELGRTFGEAGEEEKSRVSHRGRALRQMVEFLRAAKLL